MGAIQAAIDAVLREAMLFAAIGLLIGGLDDLLVDLIFLLRRRAPALSVAGLRRAGPAGRIAVFVPAWDERVVIGKMLTQALARYRHADFRIYVGMYPNDPGTIAAVRVVAARDDRVCVVIGDTPGPTTKAGCLNTLWHALVVADAAEGQPTKAIVLHDAEDLVHPDELAVFDALIGDHAVVQLPVMPLIAPGSPFVSGHYADEFAESHGKQIVVRTFLRAGMPLAGTGCAVAPWIVARLAALRGGDPFDSDSLVEDYELGLRIAELGGRGLFARVTDERGEPVAVRAYFPATLAAAVRQKARWITGIALAGWDRTGWARPLAVSDHWHRARDRRAPLAVAVLASAYVAIVAWLGAAAMQGLAGEALAPALSDPVRMLLPVNAALLAWRVAMRAAFTGRAYGWRQAIWSVPRIVVGNVVLLLAAARALWRYAGMLRGIAPAWEKTAHVFPDADAAAR